MRVATVAALVAFGLGACSVAEERSVSGPVSAPTTSTAEYTPGIQADVHLPAVGIAEDEVPVVVLVPGGGWLTADRAVLDPLARELASDGMLVINATYRAASTGGQFPTPVSDIQCAVGFAVARAMSSDLRPAQVVLVGHSSGAHLAALAALEATTSAPNAPIRSATIRHVRRSRRCLRRGAGDRRRRAALRRRTNGRRAIGGREPIHLGRRATVAAGSARPRRRRRFVPLTFTQRFADALHAAGHPVDIEVVPGAGHHDLYAADVIAAPISRWIDGLPHATRTRRRSGRGAHRQGTFRPWFLSTCRGATQAWRRRHPSRLLRPTRLRRQTRHRRPPAAFDGTQGRGGRRGQSGTAGVDACSPWPCSPARSSALGAMFATIATTGAEGASGTDRAACSAVLVFSLGLVLVVIGGAELFTGNNLLVMAWAGQAAHHGGGPAELGDRLLRELRGAIATAWLVHATGIYRNGLRRRRAPGARHRRGEVASLDFDEALTRGVLANVLVCLAVWLCFSARSVTDKVLAIILPIRRSSPLASSTASPTCTSCRRGCSSRPTHPIRSGLLRARRRTPTPDLTWSRVFAESRTGHAGQRDRRGCAGRPRVRVRLPPSPVHQWR